MTHPGIVVIGPDRIPVAGEPSRATGEAAARVT